MNDASAGNARGLGVEGLGTMSITACIMVMQSISEYLRVTGGRGAQTSQHVL